MNVAVALIALQGNQVLLVKNRKRQGSTEIPGGALRPIESFTQAAVRELYEECGLLAAESDLVAFQAKEAHGWYVQIFRVLRWTGELRAGDDASECWFGEPDLILTGQRAEDYETVMRAMYQHKAAFR